MCVLALNMMKASGESCGKGLGKQILAKFLRTFRRINVCDPEAKAHRITIPSIHRISPGEFLSHGRI